MNIKIEQFTSLDKELINEWEFLWKNSKNANMFNSPYWFISCIKAMGNNVEILILVCRSKDSESKILGILPLILSKKFGINIYMSPGGKYLDKSTYFFTDSLRENMIFNNLIQYLSKVGSFYLTEVKEENALFMKNNYKFHISMCSTGRILDFKDNPFRYMNSENNRKIRKRIRDNKKINFVISDDNIKQNINIVKRIEYSSNKKQKSEDIFSDPFFKKLIVNINNLNKSLIYFAFLYIDKEPICYKLGFIINENFHYSNTAYKIKYQKLSPGRILMYQIIDYAKEKGLKIIDFSRGETQFKREFTQDTYNQYTIYFIKNPLIMIFWRIMYFIKDNFLQDHDFFIFFNKIKQ